MTDRVLYLLFSNGGQAPTRARHLTLEKIDFATAKELNRAWHSRLPRFGTGFIVDQPFLSFAAVGADGVSYAVAIWSNPVARNLPQAEWLELRRLATAPDCPRNTPSWMMARMIAVILRDKPEVEVLVSYHDTEVHTGGIYRACGWTPTTVNEDGNWTRPGRDRPKAQSEAPKQRWEKRIR